MNETEGKFDGADGGRPSVLSLNIREKNALYAVHASVEEWRNLHSDGQGAPPGRRGVHARLASG